LHKDTVLNQSIEPKKEDWFFLYILPAFFLGMAGYSIIMLEFDSISLIMAIPFTLMAAAFHFKQKQNLRVVTLDKPGTKENFDLCIAAIKENE
jgi:hypothetical protein